MAFPVSNLVGSLQRLRTSGCSQKRTHVRRHHRFQSNRHFPSSSNFKVACNHCKAANRHRSLTRIVDAGIVMDSLTIMAQVQSPTRQVSVRPVSTREVPIPPVPTHPVHGERCLSP
ncbi:hypothetical protein SAMN06265222_11683 [Neorhodopirellula lusitana]|uniref:Uncharacterized protein n=1 Tax=Neorhodopirellula lusitana TaxID=445327 RepID=A0ABY1QKA6_9BACT|nr:hypothetical protein SAMN06265222_11683 [Neorhodopirellula lusitana]